MTAIQVHIRTPFEIVSTNLETLIALPDPEAAERLTERIMAWNMVDELHKHSYVERGLIAVQFETKKLWQYTIDPETGEHFPNFSAWMSCPEILGCRRTNFEAKKDLLLLSDVPTAKLIDVPKENIKVLTQLSTAVRNDPGILEAAKGPADKFLEKVEKEQPLQHIESRRPLLLKPGRSDRKAIDLWVEYAIQHDLAGNLTEAIVRACETALYQAQLDEELKSMPVEVIPACP